MLVKIMASYITLAGIPLTVLTPSIVMDYQPTVAVKSFIGQKGSNTTSLGSDGKELKLTVIVRNQHDVDTIRKLSSNNNVIPMVSKAKAGYNTLWRITSFVQKDKSTLSMRNAFEYDITLHEHTKFRVTKKKITNWKVDPKKKDPCPKAEKVFIPGFSYNIKGVGSLTHIPGYASDLADGSKVKCVPNNASNPAKVSPCGILKQTKSKSKDTKIVECVKELQRILKSNNLYMFYNGHKLLEDGWFGPHTHTAVVTIQKRKGIKPANGIVDEKTRAKL